MIRIVAIGGGSMMEGATDSIDREIVKLSGKKRPNALFIPTASSDDPDYIGNFHTVYEEKLRCTTDNLQLLKNPPSKKIIQQKINAADLIYVGGGNTLMMMRRWRFLGVDKMLITASKEGKVMAGTSAGAICWFLYGHSDSIFYYHPDDWEWIRVKCLGILPFTACPHCLTEGRMNHFQIMIKKKGDIGIALDDCTAMEIVDDRFRILRSKENAQVFMVYKKNGEVLTESLNADHNFKPLKALSR